MGERNRHFATTRWSLVQAACEADEAGQTALQQLCESCWQPLYLFVRSKGHGPEDAADLTQGFFIHLLEKKVLEKASQHRGKFRTFLLACIQNYLLNDVHRQNALKRGGGVAKLQLIADDAESRFEVLSTEPNPETVFEKEWAQSILDRVHSRLQESIGNQREDFHRATIQFLTSEAVDTSFSQVADEFGLTSVAVRVAVHRLREKFRNMLREEVQQTIQESDSVDEEIAHLKRVLLGR